MNPLRLTITALTLAGCVALSSLVCAEEWPAKPLRIVSPYAAGGVGDTLIRVIAPNLEARLGQRLILDNKPGAAGKIGVAEVVNARPDGYTYVIAPTANFAVNQHLFDNLGFDPLTQLDPVTTIAEAPLIAVVPTSGPASLREFAELARANPGKFNFGSCRRVLFTIDRAFTATCRVSRWPAAGARHACGRDSDRFSDPDHSQHPDHGR